MVDRDRVLAKLDELDGYLKELAGVAPKSFAEYRRVEKKRSCERLLQVAIECVIDVCSLFVRGLRLGVPGEEDDLFEKLAGVEIFSKPLMDTLKRMKGFRNILVHEYGAVDDEIVYEMACSGAPDFGRFKSEILSALAREF